ncbi:endonuclease/exonuclease/phosphatase family protein [Aurantibacter crassamenti]|uniref:endonuclease/exonuclease/phosphatase family protein n=1 Tax=Aurantibacter crassamenti TaxID=1837375 RepID=UPI00193A8358|nr:endonuclease/exonuclease/phosphatase family protein [Aurantibacter crassamenti]MBM1107136.1 endonuclease/exonuclease/phosphatase family protein [Aurantibacter crassamenti]
MPAYEKPNFVHPFDVNTEIERLKAHKSTRNIPDKSNDKLLLGSWNIANLGLQVRMEDHYKLLAEILSWFDVIAVQEVNDNLLGLQAIESFLPSNYNLVFSDKGGNNERSAFIYDSSILNQLELVGEISVPPKDHAFIKLKGVTTKFTGFDRNPYLCSFQWKNETFILITVHSFSGGKTKPDLERRALEAYAIGRYADLRNGSKNAFSKNIIALGDFNIPMIEKGDIVYEALIKRGLKLPEHSTRVYSNISNDSMYDQIAFLPSIKSKIVTQGVFDFDEVIFPELWENSIPDFKKYLRYYISDHRPMWMQLNL